MRVAAVQHDIVWEDREANFSKLGPGIARAAAKGARLVVLPEMYSIGFSMNVDRISEPPDGPSTTFLVDQAATHQVWVCGSIPVKDPSSAELPYNRFVLAGPGGVAAVYDKIHPFTYGGEHEHYAAGTQRITVTVEGVRISPFVCYDLRFSDEFWALAPDTDCYLVVANWPAPRRAHWSALLVARAIENQAYVVGVNRVGTGGGLHYSGDTVVIDPLGAEIAGAPDSGEAVVYADIDPAAVEGARSRYGFLDDRR
ncbi:nitrilase-related carbon-nitrogen hydrolase [Candidatus Poriferisocius sp.]|uniref:nitrilase-related carbon-nitrogen hydrolase n=1 Tax=Candidatus Poriferisocius sp. TaxID=3101276 RepID=UPI003B02A4A6